MVDRVKETFDLTPERLIADTVYGTREMLDWLDRQRRVAPHIPVIDKSGRKDGTFKRADFTCDAERDAYICSGGNELKQYRRAFTTHGRARTRTTPSAIVPASPTAMPAP